jgi:hypothetical protein
MMEMTWPRIILVSHADSQRPSLATWHVFANKEANRPAQKFTLQAPTTNTSMWCGMLARDAVIGHRLSFSITFSGLIASRL